MAKKKPKRGFGSGYKLVHDIEVDWDLFLSTTGKIDGFAYVKLRVFGNKRHSRIIKVALCTHHMSNLPALSARSYRDRVLELRRA